jgi:hypothetical protein
MAEPGTERLSILIAVFLEIIAKPMPTLVAVMNGLN